MKIEIFSCSGGMAEGFRRAGITFDLVVDRDPDAVASYEHNLGHRPVQLDVRDLLRLVRLGWRPRVEFLLADPPCTPWSRAGKRLGVADERDMLGVTVELIQILRPDTYLIGNVPGLQDSTQWPHLQRALAPLASEGYCIRDYVSLDAADYGVPQHRVRPFWFGHLAGPCIQWPSPTCGEPRAALPGLGLAPWVTCREALYDLPIEQLGRPVRLKRVDPKHPPCDPSEPATTVRSGGGNGNAAPHVVIGNRRHPPASPASAIGAKDRGQSTVLLLDEIVEQPSSSYRPMRADEPATTIRSGGDGCAQFVLATGPIAKKRPAPKIPQSQRVGNPAEPSVAVDARVARIGDGAAKVLEWPWHRPSTTITTRDVVPPPGHHPESGLVLSQPNAIVLSERAAARLQGFPDGWKFCGATKRARWSQLGQAMPPPLAEAVARAIVEQRGAEAPRSLTGAAT